MVGCECLDRTWIYNGLTGRVHAWADVVISVAYFSIPVELLYFGFQYKELPQKTTLVRFVLFILLCGCTHIIGAHELKLMPTHSMQVSATVVTCLTAFVSALTAILLLRDIPRLLLPFSPKLTPVPGAIRANKR